MSDAVAVEPLDGPALDGVAFARLMAPFEPFEARPEIAVGVSGGRDSLCLALLAHEWARPRDGRVVALIVDHGLRPDSAEEAEATAGLLLRQGIEASVLRWQGDKPGSGIQAAAREARYLLLRDACRDQNIIHLLVAHHADDQAETVAMRAAHGSGPDGLTGMASLVEFSEVRVLRPLLSVPRSRLTATLTLRRVRWLDDPANGDMRFERARLRASGGAAGHAPAGGVERSSEEDLLAAAGVDLLELGQAPTLSIDRGRFASLAPAVRRRLVSRVVQAVGGGGHPPRQERLERALVRLSAFPERGKSGRRADFTFAGCQFVLRRAASDARLLWIVRPENGRKGRQPLIPAAFFACSSADATHLSNSPS